MSLFLRIIGGTKRVMAKTGLFWPKQKTGLKTYPGEGGQVLSLLLHK